MSDSTERYVIGIDQSTQGTKAILFDADGRIVGRHDEKHRQIISREGWVSHDPEEIFGNVIKACKGVIEETGIDKKKISCIGISNQRETTVAWNRKTGKPYADAIVWQCNRSEEICREIRQTCDEDKDIYRVTGIKLTPYYPASKMTWLLKNVPGLQDEARKGDLALGTIDSWLVFKLTGGKVFCTDYSNASRTQLMNLNTLRWDQNVCSIFGVPLSSLPEIVDSDSIFGKTDLEGVLEEQIPVCGVLGDSHAALFGHNCRKKGGIKATYGTGSSIMLNTGSSPVRSSCGLTTSLAWKVNGDVNYVLEGNINYTGAVFSWLKDDVGVIGSTKEIEPLAKEANEQDTTYIVPAFSGLGAPWWANHAKAAILGMTRATGKKEIVKAGCESINFQINDVIEAMRQDTHLTISSLCVDGGPTRNQFLMQRQSDISNLTVKIPSAEELSAMGAAYLAGMTAGVYDDMVYESVDYTYFQPAMSDEMRRSRLEGWQNAVNTVIR